MSFTYTPAEMQEITEKGIALGKELDYLLLTKPKGSVTIGMVITATAYLFAMRATDKTQVAAYAKDIAVAINALHDQKVAKQ